MPSKAPCLMRRGNSFISEGHNSCGIQTDPRWSATRVRHLPYQTLWVKACDEGAVGGRKTSRAAGFDSRGGHFGIMRVGIQAAEWTTKMVGFGLGGLIAVWDDDCRGFESRPTHFDIMRESMDAHHWYGKPVPGFGRVASSRGRFDSDHSLWPTGAINPSLIGETGHRIPYNHVRVCGGHRQSVEKDPGRVCNARRHNTGCEKDRLPTLATYTTMIMGQRKQQTRTDTVLLRTDRSTVDKRTPVSGTLDAVLCGNNATKH